MESLTSFAVVDAETVRFLAGRTGFHPVHMGNGHFLGFIPLLTTRIHFIFHDPSKIPATL